MLFHVVCIRHKTYCIVQLQKKTSWIHQNIGLGAKLDWPLGSLGDMRGQTP